MKSDELNSMENGFEKDILTAFNIFRKKRQPDLEKLFKYFFNIKYYQYGFDTPIKTFINDNYL